MKLLSSIICAVLLSTIFVARASEQPFLWDRLPNDTVRTILKFALMYDPEHAGMLSTVCTQWNKDINDEAMTAAVIRRNPAHYAVRLRTAGCKILNSQPIPKPQEDVTIMPFDDYFSDDELPASGEFTTVSIDEDSSEGDGDCVKLHVIGAGGGVIVGTVTGAIASIWSPSSYCWIAVGIGSCLGLGVPSLFHFFHAKNRAKT